MRVLKHLSSSCAYPGFQGKRAAHVVTTCRRYDDQREFLIDINIQLLVFGLSKRNTRKVKLIKIRPSHS